jgi:hypothetical protein
MKKKNPSLKARWQINPSSSLQLTWGTFCTFFINSHFILNTVNITGSIMLLLNPSHPGVLISAGSETVSTPHKQISLHVTNYLSAETTEGCQKQIL